MNLTTWLVIATLTTSMMGPSPRGSDDVTTPSEVTPGSEGAIRRGLAFLARVQRPDGSWTERIGRKVNNTYRGHTGKHVGITSIAGIAFLAAGNLPGRGPYGENVERALSFVLSCVNVNGFITNDESRMYSHAFATLFLAEVYGTTRRTDVQEKLKRAVRLIERSQNHLGGWRYLPGSQDADISVTVCQVQALRAARNAGILVDKSVIDKAIRYVKNSYPQPPRSRRRPAGFVYQIDDHDSPKSRRTYALTAAGVTALYGAGEYHGPEIDGGLAYLEAYRPHKFKLRQSFDAYYGYYYAVQAFFQAGGGTWKRNYPVIRDDILEMQRKDGSWRDMVGPHYATSMACIILLIPYRYLPIFDR
ncbi:MAG: terpene cyclase/mutase family protein [Planctomycetota bacterium]|nr:terpene cyclase/mutase family protein [Planctomycetota bacterium]